MNPVSDITQRSHTQLLALTGRTVIITGGGSGMGEAAALRCAEAGANVVVGDLNPAAAQRTVDMIANRNSQAQAIVCAVNIADSASVANLANITEQHFGRIDAWVNTAAVIASSPLIGTSDEEWRRVVSVDMDGSFFCGREAARRMLKAGTSGAIVFVTSGSAHRGRPGRHHYVAAKHGTNGLTKSMARELGPHGIRVLSVAPGMIDTPMLRGGAPAGTEVVGQQLSDEVIAATKRDIVLGRIGTPDDVARVILFAISDASAFMTGSTLHVDGGALT